MSNNRTLQRLDEIQPLAITHQMAFFQCSLVYNRLIILQKVFQQLARAQYLFTIIFKRQN